MFDQATVIKDGDVFVKHNVVVVILTVSQLQT